MFRVQVRRARPDELALCFEVRRRVFIDEQGVTEEIEIDGLDPECAQFLAFDGDQPVGTARLRQVEGAAKAERVAVLESRRRAGTGRALMDAIEAEARKLGMRELVLNAQEAVIDFYLRLGYHVEGERFIEADIPHQRMSKSLLQTKP